MLCVAWAKEQCEFIGFAIAELCAKTTAGPSTAQATNSWPASLRMTARFGYLLEIRIWDSLFKIRVLGQLLWDTYLG